MILVDESLDTESLRKAKLTEVVGLLDAIRATGDPSCSIEFIECLRMVVDDVNDAFDLAINTMNGGKLDNMATAAIYASGSAHGMMLALCQSLTEDPSEAVRLAAATGEVLLSQVVMTPERIKVLEIVKQRRERAT